MSDKPDKTPPAKPKRLKLTPKEAEALRERAMQNARAAGWARGEDGLWRKLKPKEPPDKTD
jgi:hypothetical protein